MDEALTPGRVRRSWLWLWKHLQGPQAELWFGGYIFLVSSFLPLPSEPVLILIALADYRRARRLFIIAVFAATLGALAGYLAGAYLYNLIAPLASLAGFADHIALLGTSLDHFTFLATLTSALIPVPHPPFVLAAGLFQVNLPLFLFAFALGRAIHFGIVTYGAYIIRK